MSCMLHHAEETMKMGGAASAACSRMSTRVAACKDQTTNLPGSRLRRDWMRTRQVQYSSRLMQRRMVLSGPLTNGSKGRETNSSSAISGSCRAEKEGDKSEQRD